MTEAAPSPILDTDRAWAKNHIDEYLATNGEKPVFRYNAPIVLLTTKGRKSGDWRRTALIGASDGNNVIIVASLGGAPKHPVWYLNLEANPRVWVQQGGDAFWAVARTAEAAEKPRLWEKMVGLYPDYSDYQKKTERDIPVVVLERE
ncbi:MAG TPA: nitroreductase family deazaflavin-dependent oxidoreductase [Galbitalea sp.]|jgi:deazaflavin-dependent oxidoreductase (nitroreductase family)|nr:nitroreductase family deazaflavin-dependent oxidoreductase [Galbitalea sp.]